MGNGDWRAKGKVLRRSARNWGDTRGAALGLADTRTRRRCAPRRARAETGWPRAATTRRPRREVGEKPVARREVGEKPVARRLGEKPVARRLGEKPVARRAGEKPVAANGAGRRSLCWASMGATWAEARRFLAAGYGRARARLGIGQLLVGILLLRNKSVCATSDIKASFLLRK